MSLPFRNIKIACAVAIWAASASCARAEQVTDGAPRHVPVTTLFPGNGVPPAEDSHEGAFRHDPARLDEGKRLFGWYNCGGCHFNGAGGIGPALMDDQWIYGNRIDQVFASISQGRPNGMPSWHGKIPDAQIWEIAAFVLSISDNAPSAR